MNEVKLIGFVGKDAETRQTQNGSMVSKFTLASEDGYYDKDQQSFISKTNWHTIIAWRKLSEKTAQHIKKGWKVLVIGRLTSRVWEKEDGSKQTVVEVEAFRIEQLVHQPKSSGSFPSDPYSSTTASSPTPTSNPSSDGIGSDGEDDGLPF